MTKNLIIILALVVVFGIGYWWVNANKNIQDSSTINDQTTIPAEEKAPADEKTSTPDANIKLVVTYGANGFSPATLIVKKGDKVTFKNESGKSMWVASDNHPSHLIYPEFDSKAGIASGSVYEFTFDKVGTWNYHDHLSANKTGIIIVE